MICDDNKIIENFYHQGQVVNDITLNYRKQLLLELIKKIPSKSKSPVYIKSFVMAYGRCIVNEAVEAFRGFDDWNKDHMCVYRRFATYKKIMTEPTVFSPLYKRQALKHHNISIMFRPQSEQI